MPNLYGEITALADYGAGYESVDVTIEAEQEGTPWTGSAETDVFLTKAVTEGNTEYLDEIVGGTVAWNQLVPTTAGSASGTFGGVSVTKNGDGSSTFNGTATSNSSYLFVQNMALTAGHKYFVSGYKNTSGAGWLGFGGLKVDLGSGGIWNDPSYATANFRLDIRSGDVFNNITIKPIVTDLTQMFGSTIADYVYSLEQNTAGSGIAWLQQYGYFTEDYYAFSNPTLQSVEARSHVVTGRNLYDKSAVVAGRLAADGSVEVRTDRYVSDFIWVVPNTTYYVMTVIAANDGRGVFQYDAAKSPIGVLRPNNLNAATAGTITTAANARYIRIGMYTANVEESCVNVSDDKDGTYEPYIQTTTSLDSDLVLRGIPKLNNGNLYYDGDTYEWDGTVTRKYGTITVDGTENWLKSNNYPGNYYISQFVPNASANSPNIVNNYTPNIAINTTQLSNYDRCVMFDGGSANKNLNIKNSDIASVADFKTWLSANPITLVYKLVTETTESADPYTASQSVEVGGTEEFVTDNNVPVCATRRFGAVYPIFGWASAEISTGTAEGTADTTYNVPFGQTVYGGTLDVMTGELTVTHGNIASYNGETINEPWVSSMDEYSAGATPSTGAQVVYPLSTPLTYQLDPQSITPQPYIWADCGEVTTQNALSPLGLRAEITLVNPFE